MTSLIVNEIFNSIQGESTFAGRPCTFIRLTGCNLRCRYCDTEYAFSEGESIPLDEILKKTAAFGCSLVEITGGEPLTQKATPELVQRLLGSGYTVLTETNGSLNIDLLDSTSVRIVDMKSPSSGESDKNDYKNIERLTPKDQLKFIISDKDDYKFAVEILNRYQPEIPGGNILFSPCADILDPAQLSEWILQDHLDVRLNLQLHRIIWPDIERGV